MKKNGQSYGNEYFDEVFICTWQDISSYIHMLCNLFMRVAIVKVR